MSLNPADKSEAELIRRNACPIVEVKDQNCVIIDQKHQTLDAGSI